jgi:outer membrane protein
MKKFLFAVVVAAGTLFAGNTQAQTKIGYVRIDDIVSVMPELAPEKVNLDTVGAQFVKDSIMPSIEFKQDEYNAVVAELGDTSKTITDAVKKLKFQKMQALQQELSGAEQYIQQVLQAKQQEYLRPFYAKAKKAIEAVSKKKGYAYVLNTDVFVVAPEADDLSLAVIAELGIKLPEQPKTAPAAKPAVQPAKPAGK